MTALYHMGITYGPGSPEEQMKATVPILIAIVCLSFAAATIVLGQAERLAGEKEYLPMIGYAALWFVLVAVTSTIVALLWEIVDAILERRRK